VSRHLLGALEPDNGWNWNHMPVKKIFCVLSDISLDFTVVMSDRFHVSCLSFQLLMWHSTLCIFCGLPLSFLHLEMELPCPTLLSYFTASRQF
jgi:hypothetical protein